MHIMSKKAIRSTLQTLFCINMAALLLLILMIYFSLAYNK